MKLYLTVSANQDTPQFRQSLSLGGYKSITPLQNSVFGNLFDDISMYTVKNGYSNRYVGLILKNELPDDAKNIHVWFVYPTTCYSLLRLAAVDLSIDADSIKYMEHVPSYQSKPLYAEFVEADGEVNRVDIGDIDSGDMIGIWFERELKLDTITADQNAIYQITPSDPYRYDELVLSKEDLIEIGISWDLPTP